MQPQQTTFFVFPRVPVQHETKKKKKKKEKNMKIKKKKLSISKIKKQL
tara:strand:+ start:474 stop:617 length:144 start_codon:yes stop_codon:yes gene_type:complete